MEFAGIPTAWLARPEPGARPVMAGTLPARDQHPGNDTYGHIDNTGATG